MIVMLLSGSGCSKMLETETNEQPICAFLEEVSLLTEEIKDLSIETLRQIDNNNEEIKYYCTNHD